MNSTYAFEINDNILNLDLLSKDNVSPNIVPKNTDDIASIIVISVPFKK